MILSTYVFVTDTYHEVASFEVDFRDPRPIVMSDGGFVAEHDNSARCKTQKILDAVFTLHRDQKLK